MKRILLSVALISLVFICAAPASAMTWLVPAKWQGDTYASRANQFVFYSLQSESLLFTNENEIAIVCQPLVAPVSLTWSLSRNFFRQPLLSGTGQPQLNNSFLIRIPTASLKPGFYDIHVSLQTGLDKAVDGLCTFGWRVAELKPHTWRPADFESYWKGIRDELARLPLDAKVTGPLRVMGDTEINAYNASSCAMPPDYDPAGHRCSTIEVYKVNFDIGDGARGYAWLAKPLGKGPFPAMLILPGGGPAPRPIPAEHARHGYLALTVQLSGQDVDLDHYDQPGPLGAGPKQDGFAYRMYRIAFQAVNYLASRSDVTQIVAVGQSQGGRASLVVGTHPKVAAVVPCLAFAADFPYRKWAESGQLGPDHTEPPALPDTAENRLLACYDIINFAPDVNCPVFMYGGMIDQVSPVATVYSAFQLLGSKDKTLILGPGLHHEWNAEFDRRAWRWLDQHLGR